MQHLSVGEETKTHVGGVKELECFEKLEKKVLDVTFGEDLHERRDKVKYLIGGNDTIQITLIQLSY